MRGCFASFSLSAFALAFVFVFFGSGSIGLSWLKLSNGALNKLSKKMNY